MNAPTIIANMARGWSREPSGIATGAEPDGMSAALWASDQDSVREVWAEPDASQHCISRTDMLAEVYKDGRLSLGRAVERNTSCIMEAGVRPRAVQRGRWGVLHLYVPTALLARIVEGENASLSMPELIDPLCSYDPVIDRIGREVVAEMRGRHPLSRLRVDVLGLELGIRLLRQHSNLAGTRALSAKKARGGLSPHKLRWARDRMLASLDEDVRLADLATMVELSPEHFCRAFKQSTGLPPHTWLLHRRIERAKELLDESELTLTQIGLEVGYASQGAFGTAFRRVTGVTPSAWRRDRA